MLDYVHRQLKRRGLKAETFSGQAGDVFLWHAYLFHGRAPITDMSRTRNSLVVHYWRAGDLPPDRVRRDRHGAYLAQTLRGEITADL
jgi:ectoine hydroxylase-related dioxygenase (phytanoyl-CoA dioxygenase family)